MEVLRFRPLVVTFLLILLYGSGSLFLFGLSFISISIVVTFVCFIFKIQIDFEGFFSFIEKLWNYEQGSWGVILRRESKTEDENIGTGKGSNNDLSKLISSGTLKELPRPIARKLKILIDGVMTEFVESWYIQICPEDDQFADETRRALEHIAVEGYKRICSMDTHSAAVKIINLLTAHLKIFSDCRDAVNSKYPGINAVDFERCITELYETRIVQHVSAKSQGTAVDYLRKITDILMYVLVPQNAFSCEGGRFMLREILAIQGLQRLVDLLSDPHFVNKALIDVFEEAVPKEVILQQWKEEAAKELISVDEKEDLNNEVKTSTELGGKIDSDIYESASEMGIREGVNKQNRIPHRTKNSSYSSVEHINEVCEPADSKFATPRHSTTEWSSADESYDAFDRVLRQNQLEAKSSAPVYGSTMVKLHEKSEHASMPSIPFQIPVNNSATSTVITRVDSGYSENVKRRSNSAPLSQVDEQDEKKDEGYVKKVRSKTKQHKHLKKHAHVSKMNNDVQSRVISLHEENIDEPWSSCPPPQSSYYRKISYKEMDKRQDLLREKLKAKLHAIGSNVGPVSCMKSEKGQTRSIPDLKNSFEASMVICQPGDFYGYDDQEEIAMKDDCIKIHSIPERNAFYEVAPECPTCIEMTSLACPKENGKAVLTFEPKQPPIREEDHECGLSISHFYYPELDENDTINFDDDNESFISFDSRDGITDLDETLSTIESESTLLASSESIGHGDTSNELIDTTISKRKKIDVKSESVESFDVLSLQGSDSEFSSAADFSENGSHQNSFDSNDDLDGSEDAGKVSRFHNRATSITTFASVFDSSTQEHENNLQHFKTPLTIEKKSKPFSSITKHFKSPISIKIKKSKTPKTEFPSRILKTLKELNLKKHQVENNESSEEESNRNLNKTSVGKVGHRRKRIIAKNHDLPSKPDVGPDSLRNKEDIESSFSGTTDSDQAYLIQDPSHLSKMLPVESLVSEWQKDVIKTQQNTIEEVADEINEDANYAESFYDAKSLFGAASEISDRLTANTIDTNGNSDFGEGLSVVNDAGLDVGGNLKGDWVIPIYQGEVIMPHPGKMPVSAWMYPIQMISIPSTEVAFEKGWEPGGNKYTLYSIHYDIRIWPEIYQRQMMEASQKPSLEGNPPDGIPIIREIKRRYREFMYLHNRLTHSQMSGYMKGVLRPNRRYAMPFGRMDPDVIEGRRKILETYLVSLVSRTEVCNSREFKEFLGAEGYGSVSVVKQKVVQPKQMVNKVVGSIKGAFPAPKDATEKGESSQYFIHGYDVPRMFGYAKEHGLDRHSSPWFSSFVTTQEHREMLPEGEQSSRQKKINVIGKVEFFQRPKLIGASAQDSFDMLGPRSSGDGSDCPEPSRNGYFTESPDRRFSIGIPALFTNELAVRSRSETLSTLDARKAAEDIPWPLSDAVMSFLCQGLKGYNCWLTYENVQQALLYSLGGLLEWKISREIDEIVVEERWMKYLNDLYHVIWKDGKLIEPEPDPTEEEMRKIKEEALQKMLDFLPSVVRIIIGSNEYRKWGEGILQAVQYKKINRHLLFAAIDLVMCEFIPELQNGFLQYKTASNTTL